MAAENKPEGLKRARNPDRMYRAAVGYTGHAPPKAISGDGDGSNNEHLKIYLPKKLLECLPKCSSLPKERHRWNTNEEIAAYLITFEKHEEWLTTSPKTRPQNGSMILYNRKKVKYRKDGYCWKKRKDGKTTREDHMKLKVQGVECLYGCYVHSSIIPTFHRRCYWLLQNPDIVLVHYLNVPAIEDCGKPCGPILCSINTDKKEWAKWSKEELIGQLKPMFHGIKWTCSNGNSSSGLSAEQLVQQILDSHQTKPPPRTHNCLCTGSLGAGSSLHHKCNSAKHRIISPKVDTRSGGAYASQSEVQNNDVSEGKTEQKNGRGNDGPASNGGGARDKRNGKVAKPALLHQNSMEVSSSNQVEVPDTTQSSPVSISSGLNSEGDMADSPTMATMGHVASVMSSMSQNTAVFMSEVGGDSVYSMSPTGGPNAHLLGPDPNSASLVLAVTDDSHKFTFAGAMSVGLGETGTSEGLTMLSSGSVSEELVLSSNLESSTLKLPETSVNFDPDCFLNNPKQGQTYGGSGLKSEGSEAVTGCSNGGLGCSPTLTNSRYNFSTSLGKSIKTEDTSFEQQLVTESGYRVGELVSGLGVVSGSSSAQSALSLAPTASLMPSGGGLSPSTTLEQMDFSAIDGKREYPSNATPSAAYSQPMENPHIRHQTHSPSFFLQDTPSPTQAATLPGNTNGLSSHDSGAYMALPAVKTDSPGPHDNHHHTAQRGASSCNGAAQADSAGQRGTLRLLPFQNQFNGAGSEPDQDSNAQGVKAGDQDRGNADGLQKARTGLQTSGNGGAGDGEAGDREHFQPPESSSMGASGNDGGTSCNGTVSPEGDGTTLLHEAGGLVPGLFTTVGGHQGNSSTGGSSNGGAMEINLDHFDVSFGNQFSDLINDFISVEGGGAVAARAVSTMAAGNNGLYPHQLMPHSGQEGRASSEAASQQAAGEEGACQVSAGYSSANLCLQPCCSPQSSQTPPEPGQLAYMSAAVTHDTMGILQATGPLFLITDYSPEWSYPEGGVKVLITGPWQETSREYSCLFDQITVPASLIQPGVLRCYCPAHDTGLVSLQVAIGGQIISNSVVFEYKARALPALPSSQHDWLSLDDNQFRMSILERLEQMERRMAEMTGHQTQGSGGVSDNGGAGGSNADQSQAQIQSPSGSSFEGRVVVVCEKMMNRACWAKSKHLIHSKTFRGMTLLHLAAAQGYATLIQTLISWRTKHADSIDLELEVDPLNVDHFSCTPLMWACALGHMEAALVLYKWDRRALAIPDSLGRMPMAIARSRGHTKLAECLEQMQREELQQAPPTPSMALSPEAEGPQTEGWMEVWGSGALPGELRRAGNAQVSSSSICTDQGLRRTMSAPSSCYHIKGQEDGPPAKRQRQNPETQPGLISSAPLEHLVHKPKPVPSKSSRERESNRDGGHSGSKSGTARWSPRRKGSVITPGKSKLASRLRMRDAPGAGAVSGLLFNQEDLENTEDLQMNMMTLAEHIIEATPEHIKRDNFVGKETPLDSSAASSTMSWLASYLGDAEKALYCRPIAQSAGSCAGDGAPHLGSLGKLGLPSLSDWTAFLNASHGKTEPDLAQLALTDPEQKELYEAARQVQNTVRKYKARPLREQKDASAAVIQRCYKKYKQLTWIALKYALYKKMTLAAIRIQSKFRSYHEQKKFQQSRRAAVLIQQCYRSYRGMGKSHAHPAALQHQLSSGLLTKRQDQAARKIMRFLLRCRHSPLMDHRLFKRGKRIEKGQGT
ncbi:calmodulin-binding transcription activator 1-like isoform X4 [Denticeps clupeoides]|uniref:calmodulin-binding transcription activator 1-like isoform X4 n=1 Tax=Denticeps clupeoides TaxID=299321 RepID=UPI0010A4FD5B|nr:calmodulin-binding transcription activator 1-like isoform X4 [Denticeps clupeoides]XP_028853318.1 calmodulin-binding transcription activator 1-like isoform X4 [Denticeps clupeoides]